MLSLSGDYFFNDTSRVSSHINFHVRQAIEEKLFNDLEEGIVRIDDLRTSYASLRRYLLTFLCIHT